MREPLKDRIRLEHIQTAERMKARGYDITEICKITGLTRDEIERL